jgi:hypothetical protein
MLVRLLGAYNNGHIELRYTNVRQYEIGRSYRVGSFASTMANEGHSDWLIDEIGLTDDGYVIHEIEFVSALWVIECGDFSYNWLPDELERNGLLEYNT